MDPRLTDFDVRYLTWIVTAHDGTLNRPRKEVAEALNSSVSTVRRSLQRLTSNCYVYVTRFSGKMSGVQINEGMRARYPKMDTPYPKMDTRVTGDWGFETTVTGDPGPPRRKADTRVTGDPGNNYKKNRSKSVSLEEYRLYTARRRACARVGDSRSTVKRNFTHSDKKNGWPKDASEWAHLLQWAQRPDMDVRCRQHRAELRRLLGLSAESLDVLLELKGPPLAHLIAQIARKRGSPTLPYQVDDMSEAERTALLRARERLDDE